MREETVSCDVTVVGAGLAGVSAAISAARLGRTVALVNNRPVLGGNSSSEVRVWVCGATGHGANHFAREGGIMGELFVENQFRNPEGNPYYWDAVVLDAVLAEPNISIYLNTDVHRVEASGPPERRRVDSVTGWMMGSERMIRFESAMYLDCTGDGLVGHLAGASYRIGREGRAEYDEPWAPEVADDVTLGSTLLFYTKDAGEPVRYVPPSFAKDITTTSIPQRRIIRSGDNGCAYWWIEYGGELDTVHDNEPIRDELRSVIYGIWDYIKNSGKFEADTMTLEWVGYVPGKREYRRFLGDYVLTQHDILGQTEFDDRIAFGGWSIDLHPPGGMYATEAGARQRFADGVYHLPYRCLYSANTENLLFAGRNISASHVAFGSTRVQATCATIGQAAGAAAALSLAAGCRPAELDVAELQRTLLREDASIVGLALPDPSDLARTAVPSASSVRTSLAVEQAVDRWPLAADAGLVIPVDPALDGVDLLVDATEDTTLTVTAYDPGPGQNYLPRHEMATAKVRVAAGDKQWVRLDLSWAPESPRNAFLLVAANPALALYQSERPAPGVLVLTRVPLEPRHEAPQPLREWTSKDIGRRAFCFRAGRTSAFEAGKAIDGYLRPYAGPHLWASEPGDQAWWRLDWDEPVEVGRIDVLLDDDVDEDLINLHHHRTPGEVRPTLLRDYRIEVPDGAGWRTVAEVTGNHRRRQVHVLDAPVRVDALRVVVGTTAGAESAHLAAVRVYRR